MTLNELTKELEQLRRQATDILEDTEYEEYDDFSAIGYERTDGEALLLVHEYRGIMERLSDIKWTLEYLNRPVDYTDTLRLNDNGKYETVNGRKYYSSGTGIEFEYWEEVYISERDTWDKITTWRVSRVEHNGERYYIVGYSGLELDGLKVRVRK